MSKPIMLVTVSTRRGNNVRLEAVFDSGSFYSVIRQDRLPRGTLVVPSDMARNLQAARGSRLRVSGVAVLKIAIGRKEILDHALVSPDLARDLIIGAGAMQSWDITIKNKNGHTKIIIPRDMHDPETTEVD